MIVETMTYEKIAKEFESILQSYPFKFNNLDHTMINQVFDQDTLASELILEPFILNLDENVTLYTIPYVEDIQSYEDEEFDKVTFITYPTSKGLMAVSKHPVKDSNVEFYDFFHPEFLDMYAKRYLKDKAMTETEIIIDFFKRSFTFGTLHSFYSKECEGSYKFFGMHETGPCMGVCLPHNICLYKAFAENDFDMISAPEYDTMIQYFKAQNNLNEEIPINELTKMLE